MNKHRYCVVMCGGVGSRFWPYSRTTKPKQFLDFFGTGRSLLQQTVDRIEPLIPAENIILVTNEAYSKLVEEQLPLIDKKNILLEPARRNTASCVCWAAHHIKALDPEASIVTLPADHIILKEEALRKVLEEGFNFVESGDYLLTIGLKPTHPQTGYGYIQLGKATKENPGINRVKSFTEKPDLEMAKLFIKSGEFYWNSSMFLWKAESILKSFEENDPELSAIFAEGEGKYATEEEASFIKEAYSNVQINSSIDYAIMEKARNVYVKTAELGWSDLGSWKALYETSPHNADGNVTQNCKVIAHECKDTIFAVNGDKIIAASGLEGYVVAENDDAILICPIQEEQRIRQIVNDVRSHFGEKYL